MAEFPIYEIDTVHRYYDEDMGTKLKFWCAKTGDDAEWLFKYPRKNTGEHWAEKIAAEFGALMGLKIARVEFAVFGDAKGSMTRNIVANPNESIVHGNELLGGILENYDMDARKAQNRHTWANIRKAIDGKCGPEVCSTCLVDFAGYLILDAWIGNTDRHHENWALLKTDGGETPAYEMCPSFDHASSLGREITDGRREEILSDQNRMKKYRFHKEARSATFWDESDAVPLHNLELIKRVHEEQPGCFQSWVPLLEAVTAEKVEEIVKAVPDGWMSDSARKFVLEFTKLNRNSILECLTF